MNQNTYCQHISGDLVPRDIFAVHLCENGNFFHDIIDVVLRVIKVDHFDCNRLICVFMISQELVFTLLPCKPFVNTPEASLTWNQLAVFLGARENTDFLLLDIDLLRIRMSLLHRNISSTSFLHAAVSAHLPLNITKGKYHHAFLTSSLLGARQLQTSTRLKERK
jgi:hypothetical protein